MASVPKNVYIDKLDDTVNKYNNASHNAIKVKSVDVKWSTYIDSSEEVNNSDPKFKACVSYFLSNFLFFTKW